MVLEAVNDVVARNGARLVFVRLVLVGPGVARPVLSRLVLVRLDVRLGSVRQGSCGRHRTCSRASQMTAAAAAAAVAAAAVTAVTAATAAAASPTRYERTLRNCTRALSDFAGCTEPGAVWDDARFREWAREHRSEATKQAGRFVARLLRDKAANQSVGYTARLHVAAWKAYGVTVEQSVLDDLSLRTRDKWRPATLSRLSALGARKSDQFDLLETHWSALVEYPGSTSGEQFPEACRAAQPLQPTSIAREMAFMARKPAAELKQSLLRTRAFVSLLRCTGMRSITAVTLRLER